MSKLGYERSQLLCLEVLDVLIEAKKLETDFKVLPVLFPSITIAKRNLLIRMTTGENTLRVMSCKRCQLRCGALGFVKTGNKILSALCLRLGHLSFIFSREPEREQVFIDLILASGTV
jgi:hypothetical protein